MTTFIESYATRHTGGNCMADVFELKDGRAIVIADECIALYASMAAFENGDEPLPGATLVVSMARVPRPPTRLTFVQFVEAYEPDGPVSVDLLHLPDGRVIGIDDSDLVLYPDIGEFETADCASYPGIDLRVTDDDERSARGGVTIDAALAVLTAAKERMGGDKCLVLSLTGSEIEDANVTELAVFYCEAGMYVEVRVDHPHLPRPCGAYSPCAYAQRLEAKGEEDRGRRDQQITRLERLLGDAIKRLRAEGA